MPSGCYVRSLCYSHRLAVLALAPTAQWERVEPVAHIMASKFDTPLMYRIKLGARYLCEPQLSLQQAWMHAYRELRNNGPT